MKKIIITTVAICLLFSVGCGKLAKKEAVMKEYATDFYEKYQKGAVSLTDPTVYISQLKNANEQIDAGYDLSKLDGCNDDSYVELKIDESREITEIIYHMDCK